MTADELQRYRDYADQGGGIGPGATKALLDEIERRDAEIERRDAKIERLQSLWDAATTHANQLRAALARAWQVDAEQDGEDLS